MMKLRFSFLFWTAMAMLLLSAGYVCAQTTPSADAPPPVSEFPDTTQQNAKPETTFKINSSLVSLFFTARDKHNGLIPTLSRSDCSVFEDKQPQTIK
ncbi:MAG: hypothetical protein ACRD3F_12265, partial [Acidobacteriaceae bacterium]